MYKILLKVLIIHLCFVFIFIKRIAAIVIIKYGTVIVR